MIRSLPALRLVAAFLLFGGSALVTQAQDALTVIDLDPGASGDVLTAAQSAFRSGKSIVRVYGRSGEEPKDLLGVSVGSSSVLERQRKTDKNDVPLRPDQETTLALRGYAAYMKPNGQFRILRSFAPAKETSTNFRKWRDHMDEWVQKEQATPIGAPGGVNPVFSQQAWTMLSSVTVQTTSYSGGNFEQNTVEIYRLNAIESANDFYLVFEVPETKPNYSPDQYGYFCDGFDYCSWHTISRDFTIQPPAGGILIDHGPTGTITEQSASFSIGGSLDTQGPGVSVGFSAGWSQPSVVTTDNSDGTTANWTETMTFSGSRCDPVVGTIPPVSYGTYFSAQGAVFKVPGGTQQFTIPIKVHSSLCATFEFGHSYDDVTISQNIQAGPPLLGTSPTRLTVAAGTTAYLAVTALIPFSDNGLPWTISTNQSWLTVPSQGPFSDGQLIQVSVAGGTPIGSSGTISVNTDPPFAAPSVLQGPLQIPVTVGQPPPNDLAGVLVVGGVNAFNTVQPTPELYDATAKLLTPVGAMVTPRTGPTLTRMGNGKVLLAAGATGYDPGFNAIVTGAAEIFDPVSRAFAATGSLAAPRINHSATLLPDGKILVVGGANEHDILSSAELYDPATGSFTAAGAMTTPRAGHGAALVSGPGEPAKVIVFGGQINTGTNEASASSEVWAEATKSFSAGPSMLAGQMYSPQPTPSTSGQIEFAGGYSSGFQSTAADQILTLSGPDFATGQSLNLKRNSNTLTRLLDGSLLTTGGNNPESWLASAEVREGAAWTLLSTSGTCTPGSSGCMTSVRYNHSATLLPDGTVFVEGGSDEHGTPLGSSELYEPTTKSFVAGVSGLKRTSQSAVLIATTTTKLSEGSESSVVGQPVDFVATISFALGRPTGKVTFREGSTVLGTSPVNTSGQAPLSAKSLSVGSHSIAASYEGDSIFSGSTSEAIAHTVTKIATEVGLSNSPNPSNAGQTVTLGATVTSTDNDVSGTVSFLDGTTTLATVKVISKAAEYSTSSLAIGPHQIKAIYNGDANHEGSTSPIVTQTVSQRTTTTQLQVAPSNSSFGGEITLSASVSGQSGTPTGTVAFTDGNALLETVKLTDGAAVLHISILTAGTHTLDAKYSGDSTFDSSASPSTSHTVGQAESTITVRSTINPSTSGESVTFFATVAGPGTTPTGSVTFYDGTNALGNAQPLISGTANLSTSALAVGSHQITASFSGDANYISSASAPVPQEVRGTPTQTSISSSADPSTYGQVITLSAAVSGGSGTPTGTVTFTEGAASLGSAPLSNGVAAINVPSLATGSHSITATYSGDALHGTSASSPFSQSVSPALTQISLTADQNPAVLGAIVTLKAAVSSSAGVPSGTVGFYDGAEVIGTSPLTAGISELRTSTLSTGAHTLTARYSATGNFGASVSQPVMEIIQAPQPVPTTTSVALDPDTVLPGDSTDVAVRVSSANGSTPNGSVTISSSPGGLIGSFPLVNGRATTGYPALTDGGEVTITATYAGNSQYSGSSGSAVLDVLTGTLAGRLR